MTISRSDDWFYLRSLTGRPFHVKHCDYCGVETDANPDPALSFRIACGPCASKAYSTVEYDPAAQQRSQEQADIIRETMENRDD